MADDSPRVWTKGTIALTVVLVFMSVYDVGSHSLTWVEFYIELVGSILLPIFLVWALRVGYLKLRGRVHAHRAGA